MDGSFETVKRKLFLKIHDLPRKQKIERVPLQGTMNKMKEVDTNNLFPQRSEAMNYIVSFLIPPSSPKQDRRAHKQDRKEHEVHPKKIIRLCTLYNLHI